jgi:hypothetical protein
MELYWWLRLAQLHEIAGLFLVCLSFALGIISIFYCTIVIAPFHGDDRETILPRISQYCKVLGYCMIPCILLCFLCPDRKDLAIMFGWDALHSKTAKEVFDKVKERLLP